MDKNRKEILDFRYSRIAEISYFVMLIVVVCIILASSIGTFIIRKATNTEIILIQDNVYKFIIDVLNIFVLPVSLKIGGDAFVKFADIYKQYKSKEISRKRKQNEKSD